MTPVITTIVDEQPSNLIVSYLVYFWLMIRYKNDSLVFITMSFLYASDISQQHPNCPLENCMCSSSCCCFCLLGYFATVYYHWAGPLHHIFAIICTSICSDWESIERQRPAANCLANIGHSHASTCVNSRAFASGSRVKIAGLPERLSV